MNISDDVKTLLQDFDLYQMPVNPIKVAEALGVQYQENEHDGFEGTLVANKANAIISVNCKIKEPNRKSFTCAHELGHYQYDLNSKNNFNCSISDTTAETSKTKLNPIEIRANEFASELLMPKEFFSFWEFARELRKRTHPEEVEGDGTLRAFESLLGIVLCGPFELMAGLFDNLDQRKVCYHLHERNFYDPPEALTLLKRVQNMKQHWVCFRDDPQESPLFMAYNDAEKNSTFIPQGDNLFATLK